jgi:hypothetical protein
LETVRLGLLYVTRVFRRGEFLDNVSASEEAGYTGKTKTAGALLLRFLNSNKLKTDDCLTAAGT